MLVKELVKVQLPLEKVRKLLTPGLEYSGSWNGRRLNEQSLEKCAPFYAPA